eukprot:14238838-Alexandrium_andersonii.AAC.1
MGLVAPDVSHLLSDAKRRRNAGGKEETEDAGADSDDNDDDGSQSGNGKGEKKPKDEPDPAAPEWFDAELKCQRAEREFTRQ